MRVKNITVTVSVRVSATVSVSLVLFVCITVLFRVSAMVWVSLVWFVISNNVGGIKCRHLPNIANRMAIVPVAGSIASWLFLRWPDRYHLPLKYRQYVLSFRHEARVACDWHTHGWTDRITTAKTALALLRRATNKSQSTAHSWTSGLVDPGTTPRFSVYF